MAFVENFDAFMYDHGEPVTIDGLPQMGIFDNAFFEHFGLVGDAHQVLLIKASALGAAVEGDQVTLRSMFFTIAQIERDGTGGVILRLEV
jgi:hypothetical protein